jgi:tetratricopeptide (TPR) repeat protein
MRRQHVNWAALACLPLLVGLTWAVFRPVLTSEFVNFDDPRFVAANPYVRGGVSAESVRWAFTPGETENWHPLTWLSLMLDSELYGDPGLPDSRAAGGFHATNLVLHTLSVLLLFLALWRMTNRVWPSAATAALFAVHPLHVESVAWVAERKDVLSTFFGMLALLGYGEYVRAKCPLSVDGQLPRTTDHGPRTTAWYLLALVAFACSLLSKQMLVTLPFVFLLLDVWPLGRLGGAESNLALWRKLVVEKLPFFTLTAAFCVVAYLAQKGGGAVGDNYPLSVRAANAAIVYVLYLWKTVWPAGLAIFYPHPGKNISWPAAAGALLILAAVTGLAWTQRRGRPYLLVGWLWYLGTLVPVIGLIQIGMQRMADRYTYFPLVGVFAAVAWLAASMWPARRWQQAAAAGLAVCAIAGLGAAARRQAGVWHDSITLFTHAANVTAHNAMAHTSLGIALRNAGRLGEAYPHLEEAVRIDPGSADRRCNLAELLQLLGRYDEALAQYKESLRLDPESPLTQNRLGTLYQRQGKLDEAIAAFEKAIDRAPDYAAAHRNLARALHARGDHEMAVSHFREAVRLNAGDIVARIEFAGMLVELRRFDEAIEQYRAVLERGYDSADLRRKLGLAYISAGDSTRAAVEFQKAQEIQNREPQSQAGGNRSR